jgi:hypothetical protein
MRGVLALAVCLFAWLCVQQAVQLEQLKRDLPQALQTSPEAHLVGFLWQHLFVLPVFAISIAIGTLLWLLLSRAQPRAMVVAVLALVALVAQLVVVTLEVSLPAIKLREALQISSFPSLPNPQPQDTFPNT